MTKEEIERVVIKAHNALRKSDRPLFSGGPEWRTIEQFWKKLWACETEKDAEAEIALFILK